MNEKHQVDLGSGSVGKLLLKLSLEFKFTLLTAVVGIHSVEDTDNEHYNQTDQNVEHREVMALVAVAAKRVGSEVFVLAFKYKVGPFF